MRTSIALTLLALLAQAQPPPQPQPPVTFKVEVNYVEIDANVTDAQGNFVRTLTKDDFQVVEDGKPQTLSVFSMVDIPIERPDPPLFSKTPIAPDVVSNRKPFEGRVFVLVVDDLHTKFNRTPRTRAAARQFVERYVGANDLVAVVNTSGYGKGMQDFTSNRVLALKAIDAAMGRKEGSSTEAALQDYQANRDMPGVNSTANAQFNEMMRYNNARNTVRTLKNIADYMSGMRGRRKAVVFFSEGLNYNVVDPFNSPHATDVQHEVQDLIAAATRANVNVYSVDPRGVVTGMEDAIEISGGFPTDNSISPTQLMDEMRLEHDSLRVVAEETGGFAVLNQNDFRSGFSRILEDNSSYYVLGYYPTNEKRDGRFRNVQVHMLKPGLKVRTRKGYVAPVPAKKEPPAKGTERTSPELKDALSSPVAVSGLTLSVFAAPFKGAGANDAIALSIEVSGPDMTFKPRADGLFVNDLEIALYAADDNGKIKDGARDVVGVVLRKDVKRMPYPFRVTRRLQIPPGKYQMRIGARESGGKTGSIVYELDAPDFGKAPISLSGIVLSSDQTVNLPTASPDGSNGFKDIMPAPPSASREFSRADALSVFAEVYDNLTQAAHRVIITTSVLADDGKVVFTANDERKSEELKGSTGGGGFGHVAKIPLASFAPGRYVLRLEARPTLGNSAPISRQVEFTVQ